MVGLSPYTLLSLTYVGLAGYGPLPESHDQFRVEAEQLRDGDTCMLCASLERSVDSSMALLFRRSTRSIAGGGEDSSGCSQRPELPQLWSLEEAERLPLATLAAKGYPLLHVVHDPYPFQS